MLAVVGVVAVLLHKTAYGRYWFAIVFLVFMVPLPIALYARIASPLQLLASQFATVVLNATGVPVLCEGNMMTLPGDVQMFVAEACSGMRQLTGKTCDELVRLPMRGAVESLNVSVASGWRRSWLAVPHPSCWPIRDCCSRPPPMRGRSFQA